MARNDGTVLIEGARIVFRNFAGKEDRYNREGDRNFAVVIPDPLVQPLQEDGWNVKQFKEREDDEEGTPREHYMQVKLGYGKGKPPGVSIITDRGRTRLSEDEVEMLDWAEITNVDLLVRPYNWGPNARGESGVTAYCQNLVVTIEEDPLEKKYAELDQQG